MELITYEISQMIKVRKYSVDCKMLCETLRNHKRENGISNKQIAEKLNVPVTKVEHWFRQDNSFSIPDAEIWLQLKDLLKIQTNEFDAPIMTFEEKENVFEKGNRIYDSNGICPTITCADAKLTILDRGEWMGVKIENVIIGGMQKHQGVKKRWCMHHTNFIHGDRGGITYQ